MTDFRRWLPWGARDRDEHLADRIVRYMFVGWILVFLWGLLTGNPMLAIFSLMVLIVVPLWRSIAGSLGSTIYGASGRTVASKPAYSGPESLAVRGRYEEAIGAYEAAAADEPTDPEPWLRIARIERMDLKRPQRAIEALRAARARAEPGSPTALLAARELAEVWLRDLHNPPRAMPELARLAAEHPATPHGKWAAAELADLKQRMAAGEFDRWVSSPPPPDPSSQ